MKICHFSPPTSFAHQNRLGILLSEREVLDVNLLWSYYFRHQGFFNYQDRADHRAPPSLSKILKLKQRPLDFFQKTLSLQDQYKITECLIQLDNPEIPCKLNAPLDAITSYRDFLCP